MHLSAILIYSFAIFAMFFGSGNLVFPLQIGFAAGSSWIFGFIGLLLTGIFLPFLGLFVIKLHQGNVYRFFDGAGNIARIVLPFFTLSLLGSFGVVPRCITVAHGGLSHVFPEISLIGFSIVFCIATFILCLKESMMVKILGLWMSPLLLVFLFVLLIAGMIKAPLDLPSISASKAMFDGFIIGYQTMDLFAAFFFSALIFKQIQSSLPANTSEQQVLRVAIIPSIISSILLGLVYLGFVFLGSHYWSMLGNIDPELMLPTIVTHVMGNYAALVIALLMILSCLTTAVALNSIYAQYLCSSLKLKGGYKYILAITTTIACALSLLDFKGIAKFLAPALEVSYPGLIALTIMSIFFLNHKKEKIYLFWSITMITTLYLII
jgi:branched-chain amino acid:cation transporter, LIVCS family